MADFAEENCLGYPLPFCGSEGWPRPVPNINFADEQGNEMLQSVEYKEFLKDFNILLEDFS